jgi:hypothetical protein
MRKLLALALLALTLAGGAVAYGLQEPTPAYADCSSC